MTGINFCIPRNVALRFRDIRMGTARPITHNRIIGQNIKKRGCIVHIQLPENETLAGKCRRGHCVKASTKALTFFCRHCGNGATSQ